jgi:four helix bundle protein
MTIRRFEDIIAWQKAKNLAVDIYRAFSKSKDFRFRDQICRAAVSISSNIAEGFERRGDKEFIRFLRIAAGSASETKSLVYIARDLRYIESPTI